MIKNIKKDYALSTIYVLKEVFSFN